MLLLLDKYLYDNPKQNTHCMSSDNEYVRLLKYAIHLNIDLSSLHFQLFGLYSLFSLILKIANLNMSNFYSRNTTHTMQTNLEDIW